MKLENTDDSFPFALNAPEYQLFARKEPQNENSTLSILDLKGTLIMNI